MKNSLLVLAIALAGYFDCYAQPTWGKIPPNVTKDKNEQSAIASSKPYKDKDYNYGSETNPSPRTDAVTWADPKGTLWLFGGSGLNEGYGWGIFQDMWKYDPATNKWELVKGKRNAFKVDEKQDTELPAPRKDAASWVDNNGNLWMFGGRQLGDQQHLDDMWMFERSKGSWSKVSGKQQFNQSASWGQQKTSDGNNTPGSRSDCTSWTDKNGNLWLFGGLTADPDNIGLSNYYNDLWVFDIKKTQWQWVAGINKPNQFADTLVNGKDDKGPTPSSRSNATGWYDAKRNTLWLYGGTGYGISSSEKGGLSDMWSYAIDDGKWMKQNGGFKINTEPDVFSASSTGSKLNSPGRRIGTTSWTDKSGILYLMGGYNQFLREYIHIDRFIWKYDTETNQWSILPQTAAAGIGGGTAFTASDGTLYFFGGKEFDEETRQARPANSVWKLKQ